MTLGTFRVDDVENRELQIQHASRILDAPVGSIVNGIKVTERVKFNIRKNQVKAAQNLQKAGGTVSVDLPGSSAIDENGESLKETDYKKLRKKVNKNRDTSLRGEKLKRTYRDRGGVLRYPYEALTEKTDYLQIDINQYESARERSGNEQNLIGRVGTRRLPSRGRNPFGLTTKSLVNKGTVLLQIPSQVQDGNSVSYGDSKMNSIVGAALQATTDITIGAADALVDTEGNLGAKLSAAGEATKEAVMAAFRASDINGNNLKTLFNAKIATGVVGAFGGNVSVNQLLARQSGQIFNPNMELLLSLIHI